MSSQLVKSTWKVTPIKSWVEAHPKKAPRGVQGGRSGHGHGKKESQNWSLLDVFFQTIFSAKDVLEIIFSLICTMTMTRKTTLRSLESVEKMSERGYCFVNLSWNFADSRRVKTSWIPGTYTLFTINKFTEMFSDDDEWIFSLCWSPFSVYYLCHFVTVCTVKRMWSGGYVANCLTNSTCGGWQIPLAVTSSTRPTHNALLHLALERSACGLECT